LGVVQIARSDLREDAETVLGGEELRMGIKKLEVPWSVVEARRVLILGFLLGLALLLHTQFCEWNWSGHGDILRIGPLSLDTEGGRGGGRGNILFGGSGADRETPTYYRDFVCGVIVPSILVGITAYFSLGWYCKVRDSASPEADGGTKKPD